MKSRPSGRQYANVEAYFLLGNPQPQMINAWGRGHSVQKNYTLSVGAEQQKISRCWTKHELSIS